MSKRNVLLSSLAVAGLLVATSAKADTRAGSVAPRATVASKVTAAPKVARHSDTAVAYGNSDGTSTGVIAGLAGLAIGFGGCVATHCYGHTSP